MFKNNFFTEHLRTTASGHFHSLNNLFTRLFILANMIYHGFQAWWISWALHLENFTKQTTHRSSRSLMFFRIGVLKNFTNSTGEICKMFKITFFYKSPLVAASWPSYCCTGRRISLRYQLELVWLNWLTFIYTCWISVFYPAILHLKVTEAAPLVFYKKALRNIHWEAPVLLIKNETY